MLTLAAIATAALLTLTLAACAVAAAPPRRIPINRSAYRRAQAEWRNPRQRAYGGRTFR